MASHPLKAALVKSFENRPDQLKDRSGDSAVMEILTVAHSSNVVGWCKSPRGGSLQVPASKDAEASVAEEVLKVAVAGQQAYGMVVALQPGHRWDPGATYSIDFPLMIL